MRQARQLRNTTARKAKKNNAGAVRLSDILTDIMDGRVSLRQSRFEQITKHWEQLLPYELARHCKIEQISAGQLKVRVDEPSYRYEIQLCCPEILKQLGRQCPSAHIKKIKLVCS